MVEKGSVVADVGCDHGLLSIELMKQGIAQHIYACDLREGPLSRAKEAIAKHNFQQQITTLLSDGLTLVPDDVDTIIIAGMGHETILHIVEQRLELVHKAKRIIVQTNKHADAIRHWISEHHFTILEEDIVEEDHYYEIICFCCSFHDAYSEEELLFGTNDELPLFVPYLTHRLHQLDSILQHIPKQESMYEIYQQRYEQIQKKLTEKSHSSNS